MASLLNNASLLLNPAGSVIAYEEDKIFSVLPNNGGGDFTFTGGDGGTRVNQQGYIEVTPANLASNSNSFTNNGGFTKTGSLPGPFSSTDGNILTPTGTGEKYSGIASLTVPANTVFTFSVYAKYLQNTQLALRCVYSNGAQDQSTIFNLQTNTVVSLPGTHSNPQIIPAGGGWFRYSVDINSTTPPAFPFLFRVNAANNGSLVFTPSSGDGFYISSAQVNTGGLKPYQPTTDRLNYPRITYQNGKGALLQEPARTNLSQGSNGLTTNWTNYRGTYTANAIVSPDGTVNAPLTVWDGSSPNSVGFYFTNLTFASSTTYCLSFFLKYYNKDVVNISYADRSNPYLGGDVNFNIAGGTVGAVGGSATKGIIEPYKDGWYKCTVVFTTVSSPSYNYISVGFGGANEGEGFYVYGSQLEVGEFPTTYIPTTTATVTRPMDQFSKNDSPALTTTDWTFYMSGIDIGKNKNISGGNISNVNWSFDSGGGAYGPNSLHNYSNNLYYYTTGLATLLGTIGSNALKIAVTKTGNTFKLFRNGVLIQTTSPTLGNNTWDSFRMYGTTDGIGKAFSNNPSTLSIIQTAFSDSDAQTLTTINSGSGGTISYYGQHTIHTFTGSGTFTPSFNGQVEVLIAAGGGSGGVGSNGGGAGGAGGLIYVSSYGVSQGTGVTITVGAGGPYRNGRGAGNNGSNSVFGGLTTIGGGGGGGASGGPSAGKDGGSGGGAQYNNAGGSGISGQGNDGGDGNYYLGGNHDAGGGGGGAGFAGLDATLSNAGNGGDGLPYSISGFSTYYAGGGGGSSNNASSAAPHYPGEGGLGGGGKGGIQGTTLLGTDGVDGLGAGGGAGVGSAGGYSGAGGDGIVIVRYLT